MPKIIAEPKKQIEKAAREELADKGIGNLSRRGIAKRCSLGVGTIYHYYPDKLSLLTDLLDEDWQKKSEEAKEKIQTASDLDEDVTIVLTAIEDFRSQSSAIFHSYQTDDFPAFYLKLHPFFVKSILSLWDCIKTKENVTVDPEIDEIIAELIILASRPSSISKPVLLQSVHKLVS